MAEFLSRQESDQLYGTKGKTNSALTLGVIGTSLGALGLLGAANNNNGCCGCGNNGGILGAIFGNNNNCCCEAKQAMNTAQNAMTAAILEGQQADNLAWSTRVASMHDDADVYRTLDARLNDMTNIDWNNRVQGMSDLADYAQINETRLNNLTKQDYENRIHSIQDDAAVYASAVNQIGKVDDKLSSQVQILTNQSWKRREEDLQEKADMYTRLSNANDATNRRICEYALNDKDEKFQLYKMSSDADAALDSKFTKMNYEGRIQDLNEKFDMFTRLNNKITDLEKAQAKTETALPLMFELTKVNAERYSDNCCCQSEKNLLIATNGLQRQLDHKIDGQLKYAYADLCAPVPNISPLYCTPFTANGSGTTWTGCCNNSCQSL